jgi:hypothetical protein
VEEEIVNQEAGDECVDGEGERRVWLGAGMAACGVRFIAFVIFIRRVHDGKLVLRVSEGVGVEGLDGTSAVGGNLDI